MPTWGMAILRCINSLGGAAHLQQIYERLPNFIDLTEMHLRATKWGGRPAYQHQVRSHITNLCQDGELIRISRGFYALAVWYEMTVGVMNSFHPDNLGEMPHPVREKILTWWRLERDELLRRLELWSRVGVLRNEVKDDLTKLLQDR